MRGMTGYGYAERNDASYFASVECKAVNNKYTDIVVTLPPELGMLEERFKEKVRFNIARGRVEIYVRLKQTGVDNVSMIDDAILKQAIVALEKIQKALGNMTKPTIADVLAFEGIIGINHRVDVDASWQTLEGLLDAALLQLDEHRGREGVAIHDDVTRQLDRLEHSLLMVIENIDSLEDQFKASLRSRFMDVLGDTVEESRILQEVAVMLVRYSVHEETQRLAHHLKSARELIDGATPAGKRLDFLAQEMNREVNTIGSKCVDPGVSAAVVDMKEAIDNIREQARNVE